MGDLLHPEGDTNESGRTQGIGDRAKGEENPMQAFLTVAAILGLTAISTSDFLACNRPSA